MEPSWRSSIVTPVSSLLLTWWLVEGVYIYIYYGVVITYMYIFLNCMIIVLVIVFC